MAVTTYDGAVGEKNHRARSWSEKPPDPFPFSLRPGYTPEAQNECIDRFCVRAILQAKGELWSTYPKLSLRAFFGEQRTFFNKGTKVPASTVQGTACSQTNITHTPKTTHMPHSSHRLNHASLQCTTQSKHAD
jgi:hypothetical protein